MSIIVAMFTGQYKSLLTCRSCKYESARFEPFSFLQLPLPEDDHISVSLIFYPLKEGSEPTKYSVRVRHDGKLLDVLVALAKLIYEDEVEIAGNGHHSQPKNGEEGADGVDSALQEQIKEMAKNMAVVDMRDGYIFKIAPVSFAVSSDSYRKPVLCLERFSLVFFLRCAIISEFMGASRPTKQRNR
jgi:hypothetical protein